MLNVKWDNRVTGYLSKSEKELCEKIDREISAINAVSKTEISVVITNIFKEPEKLPRIQNSWQLLFLCFVLVFTIIFRLILLCGLLLMSNW